MTQPEDGGDLVGLALDAARALLGEAEIVVTETLPPLGAKSPLRGATNEGAWRVLRAERVGTSWELLVAREQTRA